jgi:hypothetical protein
MAFSQNERAIHELHEKARTNQSLITDPTRGKAQPFSCRFVYFVDRFFYLQLLAS